MARLGVVRRGQLHIALTKTRFLRRIKARLSAEELQVLRDSYTGVGGLVPSAFDGGQFFTPRVVTEFVVAMLGV